MTQLDKCKGCNYYVLNDIQPKGGILYHCKFNRPLNMPCGKYKSRIKSICPYCNMSEKFITWSVTEVKCTACSKVFDYLEIIYKVTADIEKE